jgi:hypothetical protein
VRFIRLRSWRVAGRRALVVGCLTLGCLGVLGGRALAGVTGVSAAPLAGSPSGTLTEVNTGEWTTTIYLDTAALCTGSEPAGNTFSLVTSNPNSVTGAAVPSYPDGPLSCETVAANPVTDVELTFVPSPALSAVPQEATLIVTPPQALLQAGDPPLQIPLTVRRAVSPWQYVGIPAICGGALALLLVLLLMAIGMPGPGQSAKRVHWGPGFWRTPLFAGAAWSFSDSWAAIVAPLTALAGGVLTASGAVAGLLPGVDLTVFGQLMILVASIATLAPLTFGALNSLFPVQKAGATLAPAGDVITTRLWGLLLASSLTVFAIGAEIGLVGLVLGFDLIVASPVVRLLGPVVTGLAALLFLSYRVQAIFGLTAEPTGAPKQTARKSSFII